MVRVSCCYEAGREQARGERAHYCLPEKFKEKSGRRSPMRARSHMTCSDRKNTRALPCCCDCQQCKQIAKFWEKASYYEKKPTADDYFFLQNKNKLFLLARYVLLQWKLLQMLPWSMLLETSTTPNAAHWWTTFSSALSSKKRKNASSKPLPTTTTKINQKFKTLKCRLMKTKNN